MHCYNHKDKEAICTCHSCNKGLCSDCSVEVSSVMACKDSCEERVQNIVYLVNKNIRALKSGRYNDHIEIYRMHKNSYMGGITFWGLLFIYLTYLIVESLNESDVNIIAILLIILCSFMLYNSIRGLITWRKLELKK